MAPYPAASTNEMICRFFLPLLFPGRFSLRLLPVEATCYASIDCIEKAMAEVARRHFPCSLESEAEGSTNSGALTVRKDWLCHLHDATRKALYYLCMPETCAPN